MDWAELIREGLDHIWIRALGILLLAVLLSRVAGLLFEGVLLRLARRTRWDIDERVLEILRIPLYATILLVGVSWAVDPRAVGEVPDVWARRVLWTAGVFVWCWALLRLAGLVVERLGRVADRFQLIQKRTVPLFDNMAKILLVGAAAYVLMVIWGINVSAWLASAGILGLAIGLAAKDTLANLFAGVFILADAPYKIGDFILLDSGERGEVTEVGLRSTRILTRDDVEITIPNAHIASSKVSNQTGGRHPKLRVRVTVDVAYGSDVDEVRAHLLEVGSECSLVCPNPEPRVRFREFGDSGLRFQLLCWVQYPVQKGRALDALNTAVYKSFMTNRIEIPYPKRDLYIKEAPAPLAYPGGAGAPGGRRDS